MPVAQIKDNVPLYYEVYGDGNPLLFIHPPGMGLVTFSFQKPLSKNYQLITFDMRGNGQSGANNEKITIALLANDIKDLIDHLEIEKIVLCGYSNGGSIALEFALRYSNRVNGIILIGGFPEVNTFLLRTEFLLGINTLKFHGLSFLAKVLGNAHGKSKEVKKQIEEYVLKANPEILHQMYVEGLKYSCTERLHEIQVPVLLVDGALDFYMHSYQKLLVKNLAHANKVYIPKARHQIPTKHDKALNNIIDSFMNTHYVH